MKSLPVVNAGSVLCPSARPDMEGSVVFGIIVGTVEQPRLAPLETMLPVTAHLLALAGPVSPTEVFRFAAPCAGDACRHFDGAACTLASRIAERLPPAVDALPPCRLRPRCRWWRQEGTAACLRCPQIVTETYSASETMRAAADPETAARL